MGEEVLKLYAARDKNTGKFVRDLTNPGHKFWELKKSCRIAIDKYNTRRHRSNYDLELVELSCIDSSHVITDSSYLSDWYQNNVDNASSPIWTDAHIEQLLNDFILIPKTNN